LTCSKRKKTHVFHFLDLNMEDLSARDASGATVVVELKAGAAGKAAVVQKF
jgi:RecB family endonuclease NucS